MMPVCLFLLLEVFLSLPTCLGRPVETEEGGICLVTPSSGKEIAATPLLRAVEVLEKRFNRITGYDGGGFPPVFVTVPEAGEERPLGLTVLPGVDVMEG